VFSSEQRWTSFAASCGTRSSTRCLSTVSAAECDPGLPQQTNLCDVASGYHQYFPQLGGSSVRAWCVCRRVPSLHASDYADGDVSWLPVCEQKEAQARRALIAERVRAFWGEIRARVPQRNCVVDFAVLGEDRVVVIEVLGSIMRSLAAVHRVRVCSSGRSTRSLPRPAPACSRGRAKATCRP
jgi:hypothetical protein